MKSKRVLALCATLLLGGVSACGTIRHAAAVGHSAPLTMHTAQAALLPSDKTYVGVYESGVPKSYALINEFAERIGQQPSLVLYYSAWYTPFQVQFADTAYSHGSTLLVQIQPNNVSLEKIAAGKYDRYLSTYAAAVRAFGHPVVLSFAHEMNGTWYDWGAGHVAPSVFVAAWRHVVDVFRQAGADNVTWMWTVNSLTVAHRSLDPWWPGAAWVDWVGIDGYYVHSTDTFQIVFGTTLANIRQFTSKPVLLSEVGIGPQPSQVEQIQGLFQGIEADHLLGIVWFDQSQDDGIYHQDWRLEDSPDALAEFRTEAASFKQSAHG